MNRKRIEIKDDGEVVILTVPQKDFARIGGCLRKAGIEPKESRRKEATFIFPRATGQYGKVISWADNISRGVRIVRSVPFLFVEIEDSGQFLDIHSNMDIRPDIYLCSSCGFTTEDISATHEERRGGGVTHQCPVCRNFTGSGSLESWESRDEDIQSLEKKFKIEYLNSAYGCDDHCAICKEEVAQ